MTKEVIETRKITQTEAEQCAAEPIQIIGSIQPHGFQLILDRETHKIVQHSLNALTHINQSALKPIANHLALLNSPITQWVNFVDADGLARLSSKKASLFLFNKSKTSWFFYLGSQT